MNEKIKDTKKMLQRKGKFLIPKRVTIETIFGCNAHCQMCVIDHPTPRKKGDMPEAMFRDVVDSLVSYTEHIEMFNLFGLGEPLLDRRIFERIRYVKEKGFRNLAISTNAHLLNMAKQRALLDTGIDTVLFSIDGVNKHTHESIRRGIKFERVVENCQSIIRMRDDGAYKTRFVIRFIRQDINRNEWEPFKLFWQRRISREKKDFITAYDAHSWGGELSTKDRILKDEFSDPVIEEQGCYQIFEILYVLSDGSVSLCSEDWLHSRYGFGNVTDKPPIEIWNSDKFNSIREVHLAGNRTSMDKCRECTVLYSLSSREVT